MRLKHSGQLYRRLKITPVPQRLPVIRPPLSLKKSQITLITTLSYPPNRSLCSPNVAIYLSNGKETHFHLPRNFIRVAGNEWVFLFLQTHFDSFQAGAFNETSRFASRTNRGVRTVRTIEGTTRDSRRRNVLTKCPIPLQRATKRSKFRLGRHKGKHTGRIPKVPFDERRPF